MPQTRSQPAGPRQPVLQVAPHRNHGLFSDHYLNDTLPGRADWQVHSRSAEVAEALAKLQSLYTHFAPHSESSNEAQTEDGFIKPVLQVLGHLVERMVTLTAAEQAAHRDLFDWLRTEFEVVTPGQRLADFASCDEDVFVAEVRKRRPGKAPKLSPASLRALKDGFNEVALPSQARRAEAAMHERRLADLVNTAYGLTPEEVALLWETAPPRMPTIARPDGLTG